MLPAGSADMMHKMMDADTVRRIVENCLASGHFFVAHPRVFHLHRVRDEDVAWEIFGGHLLGAAHSPDRRRFDAWHIELVAHDARSEPARLTSVYWDRRAHLVAVVRYILTHGHEAYEDAPGVILSRPAKKWSRELAGTIDLAGIAENEFQHELGALLFLAVIGVSRLPITSLESPLPGFSLGEFAYFPSVRNVAQAPWSDSLEVLRAALAGDCHGAERVKVLEMALRATPDTQQPRVAQALFEFAAEHENQAEQVVEMLLGLFRYVALSPYGNYVDRLLTLLAALAEHKSVGTVRIADVIATMLTQLGRHLTAFDLATFHNFGANYPDALYLDGLLKLYFSLLEHQPHLFLAAAGESEAEARTRRLLRRGLRQGCLLRKHYEGLLVPDAPTSQGEALRVLPEPFARVPEEQILQPAKRRRRLFADEPLEALLTRSAQTVLQQSLADLNVPAELRELGTAYFLDRPLGITKRPGEVDRTPLVSHTAVSRAVIRRRVGELKDIGWLSRADQEELHQRLEQEALGGIPVAELALAERPGVVSLADALKVSADFVIVRSGAGEALQHYEWPSDKLPWAGSSSEGGSLERTVLVHHVPPHADATLRLYDSQWRLRVEFGFERQHDGRVRFVERAGVELPERLQAVRAWEYDHAGKRTVERDLRGEGVWLTLRGRESPG
jgi:hypothetical protein